jgi:hypothetical protein
MATAVLMACAIAHADAPVAVNFNRDIRPVLSDRCFACHGPDANTRKADLRLDDEASAKLAAIVAGKPDESPLFLRITTTNPDDLMPPPEAHKPALNADEVALFRQWIAEGAPWAKHWAYEKPVRVEPPAVQDEAGMRNPIDRFLQTRLEAEGFPPNGEATRETLLRRVSFDITGLPPTPAELDAFVADTRPDAFERQVDRLMASPHYGERMAMDWLDGARYADSNGYQNDFNRAMWPWRDWVIQAYNDNMPFDQFAVEQIAGDLLPNANDMQRVATGFCRNNRSMTEGGSLEEEWHVEKVIDRVETTSIVFLGLTTGCARCHDHKYDPISQREFYQMYAFFNASEDKGFYEETRGNAGPLVSLPTYDQQLKIGEFENKLAAVRTALATAQADTESGFQTWKAALAADSPPTLGKTMLVQAPLQGDLNVNLHEGTASATPGTTPPRFAEGILGQGVEFDGTGETYLDLGQPVRFEQDQKFSVSLWMRPDGPGAPFSKTDDAATSRGYQWVLTAEGDLEIYMVSAWPDSAIKITANERLPMGKWSHVCVTYDGSGRPESFQIYIAGRLVTHKKEQAALTSSIDTEQPLRLGRSSNSNFFKGAVADFRVFGRVLTAKKVKDVIDDALIPVAKQELSEARQAQLREFFTLRGDDRVTKLDAEVKRLAEEKAAYERDNVATVMVMKELAEPRPTYRLERGQYNTPDISEALQPGVPAFLPPLPEGAPNNRLGLAKWIVDPDNPLTARVTVNRMWNKFFGQGLVKSPDNFGVQTEAPMHPELLDWLATELIATGWDLKAMQKLIVSSATYRRASTSTPEMRERDPENRLYARGPRFRLPAELVRDNALAVGGLLTGKIGGPSVKPYQPEGLWAELAGGAGEGPYVQSKGEDLYRRSMYTYRKRTVPHPITSTFDAPSWEFCTVYRARTNTPLQALALLNDTTYVEAARNLAQRMLTETTGEAAQRVAYGFRLATGRMPTASETTTLEAGLYGYAQTYTTAPQEAEALLANGEAPVPEGVDRIQLAAYTAVAGVILNLDETITKE